MINPRASIVIDTEDKGANMLLLAPCIEKEQVDVPAVAGAVKVRGRLPIWPALQATLVGETLPPLVHEALTCSEVPG
jgi:hypothetical protein